MWARIPRISTAKWLANAVRSELVRLSGIVGPVFAARALAARLARRIDRQGPHAVEQLTGWLLHRGLPQRSGCWSHLCDDGYRMGSGGPCESCACLIDDRRSTRRSIAATVAVQLAAASPSCGARKSSGGCGMLSARRRPFRPFATKPMPRATSCGVRPRSSADRNWQQRRTRARRWPAGTAACPTARGSARCARSGSGRTT